jgi:hypothetical protein
MTERSTRVEIDYTPFEKTILLHRAFETHRIRVAVTGARGGKTTCGVADCRDKALLQPHYDHLDIDKGEPYTIAIGAPDYPTLERVVLPAWLRAIPRKLIVKPYHGVKREMEIQGRLGPTHIYFLSAGRPESWQGLKLYGAWIDEFPLIDENMFNEVQARLSDRKGWLLLTGTPRGPNWAKERLYNASVNKTDPELFFITWKTLDNPYIPREEIERLRKTMPPKYFRRTFEASWDIFEGQIYEEYLEAFHVRPESEFTFVLPSGRRKVGVGKREVKLKRVIGGIDWGYGVGHPGAILVLAQADDGKWYVVEESHGEQILIASRTVGRDSWTRRAKFLQTKWEVRMFFADNANPQNIAALQAARVEIAPAMKQVKEGIQVVADHLRVNEEDGSPRLYILNTCENTRGEIVYYHWKAGKEEPVKVNDHCMDALRYALYTYYVRGTFVRERNYVPR